MSKAAYWLAPLAIIAIVFSTIYGVAQQLLRLDANDPQIVIAEDTAAAINKGAHFDFVQSNSVDAGHSLSPFIVIYDKAGKVVTGSGRLAGKIPVMPIGVLKAAQGKEYNTVTWQPDPNVRLAAVAVATKDGYVVSARSLKEVEKRESYVMLLTGLGWLFSMIVLGLAYWLAPKHLRLLRHKS